MIALVEPHAYECTVDTLVKESVRSQLSDEKRTPGIYARRAKPEALSNLSTCPKAQRQRGAPVTNGAAGVYTSRPYEPGAHVTNGTQGIFTVSGQVDQVSLELKA
ncbi:hypothetical protein MTO96_029186 [Rhipicephalus appendiculatus]